MLNIFYQNNTLNDTLIINVSLDKANKIVESADATMGYKDDNLVFMNIKNAKSHFNDFLADGILFPYDDFMASIKDLYGIDLLTHFNNGFIVGQVTKCDEIKGTHLHNTEVNIGNKTLKIVCGAPNCKAGLKVVCATNGTMLPDGKAIISGQLLGNVSEGMLCSFRELGIDKPDAPKGIIELGNEYKVGEYYHQAYANHNRPKKEE